MSAFANVFVGNTANDGTGDPLRTAFQTIDQNFASIANGNITVNAPVVTVAGRTGNIVLTTNDVAGAVSIGYVNAITNAANSFVTSTYSSFAQTVFDDISANLSGSISNTASTIAENLISSNNLLAPLYSVNANVTAANLNISGLQANLGSVILSDIAPLTLHVGNLDANLGTATTNITTLLADASAASTAINLVNSNVANVNSVIGTIEANLGTATTNISSLTANTVAQQNALTVLTNEYNYLVSNVGTFTTDISGLQTEINSVNANVTAANLAIVNSGFVTGAQLAANITAIDTSINSGGIGLSLANVKIQTLDANLGTATTNITALFANAGMMSNSLIASTNNLIANVNIINANLGLATTNISTLFGDIGTVQNEQTMTNANVTAANTHIQTIDANLGTTTTNITTLFANAASQAMALTLLSGNTTQITTLFGPINANVTAANANIGILFADITAINSNTATITANLNTQLGLINAVNANVTAANAAIATFVSGSGFATMTELTSNIANIRVTTAANVNAANAAIATLQTQVYGNANVASYLTADPTINGLSVAVSNIPVINANVTAANLNITTLQSNVNTLQANGTIQHTQILTLQAGATATNAAIVTANTAVTNYATALNAAMLANVTAANSAIITANTGMLSYVNSRITSNIFNSNLVVNNGSLTNDNHSGGLVITGSAGAAIAGNVNIGGQLFVGQQAQQTVLQSAIAVWRGTSNSGPGNQYTQVAIINSTNTGSSDLIAYPNNITNDQLHGWVDVGIAGDAFNDPDYTITKSNDSYLFGSGANASVGGNLVIATDSSGSYNDIVFATGGFLSNNEVARIHGNVFHTANLTINGNIPVVSNVARFTWVANVAPISTQGSVGDIWYQTF